MNDRSSQEKIFVYLDPPYFEKGRKLYLNYYKPEDHEALATFLKSEPNFKWVPTYDNAPQIVELYSEFEIAQFSLRYSLQKKSMGTELLIRPQVMEIAQF